MREAPDRGIESDSQGGLATDEVAPTQFEAYAFALDRELQAFGGEGQDVVLPIDTNLPPQGFVELSCHERALHPVDARTFAFLGACGPGDRHSLQLINALQAYLQILLDS